MLLAGGGPQFLNPVGGPESGGGSGGFNPSGDGGEHSFEHLAAGRQRHVPRVGGRDRFCWEFPSVCSPAGNSAIQRERGGGGMLRCASLTPAPAFCGWKGAKRCQMLCRDTRPLWMKGTVLGRRGRRAARGRGGGEVSPLGGMRGSWGLGKAPCGGLISGSSSIGRHFSRDLSERRETFSRDQLSDPNYPPPAHHLHRPLLSGAGVERRRRQHPVMAGASLQPGERPGGYG